MTPMELISRFCVTKYPLLHIRTTCKEAEVVETYILASKTCGRKDVCLQLLHAIEKIILNSANAESCFKGRPEEKILICVD